MSAASLEKLPLLPTSSGLASSSSSSSSTDSSSSDSDTPASSQITAAKSIGVSEPASDAAAVTFDLAAADDAVERDPATVPPLLKRSRVEEACPEVCAPRIQATLAVKTEVKHDPVEKETDRKQSRRIKQESRVDGDLPPPQSKRKRQQANGIGLGMSVKCEEGTGDDAWIRFGDVEHGQDEEEEEEEETGAGSTTMDDEASGRLAAFRRSRFLGRLGTAHPEWLTEPASISRVTMPQLLASDPPLRIPMRVASAGLLSSPQLEAVAYAARRFRSKLPDGSRAGYYLGDGTGTGKGRIIAALMWHLWNEGARRHVWLSASADLLEDARRDLRDIGAPLPVAFLGEFPYGKIEGSANGRLPIDGSGVLFATYSLLVAGKADSKGNAAEGRSVNSRFGQIVEWLGGASANGLVAFDEAHKAKNTGSGTGDLLSAGASKTGLCVTQLQSGCPGIACLYASATGATEIRHLGYMERLGLVGLGRPHRTFDDLRCAVEGGGLAAMELVAITMRAEGMLACRALSFRGASFTTRVVSLEKDQSAVYSAAATLWQDLFRTLQGLLKTRKTEQKQRGHRQAEMNISSIMRHFWAQQQRFFRQMLVCVKVGNACKLAQDALVRGEQVVISMWSTGEAQMESRLSGLHANPGSTRTDAAAALGLSAKRRAVVEQLDDFVCGLEVIVERLLQHTFEPLTKTDAERKVLRGLKNQVLSANLPTNPLDTLIDRLGGPERVAELTGRTRRLLNTATGQMLLEERVAVGGSAERTNVSEQRAFQEGRKRVAIITEAASAGISLHSERRDGMSQAQRYMLTLELPWEADKAVQQLGRVHRSNQARPPRFAVLLTELGGECRFASAIARRMRLLGAITRGDRAGAADATGGLAEFDVQNRYGKRALDNFYQLIRTRARCPVALSFIGFRRRWSNIDSFYKSSEVALSSVGIRLDTEDKWDETLREGKSLNTFLNRILMLEPETQNALFEIVQALYAREVRLDKAAGTYDAGLETLNRRHGNRVKIKIASKEVLFTDPDTGAETTYVRLLLDRGLPWEAAERLRDERCEEVRGDGLYWWRGSVGANGCDGLPVPALAVAATSPISGQPAGGGGGSGSEDDEDDPPLILYTPQGALTKLPGASRRITCASVFSSDRFRRAGPQDFDEIARVWRTQYLKAGDASPDSPESRFRQEHILAGSILNVWGAVGAVVRGSSSKRADHLPLMRARPDGEDDAVVGVRVDPARLGEVRYALSALLESRLTADTAAPSAANMSDAAQLGKRVTAVKKEEVDVETVPVPSFNVVHTFVKAHLEKLPDECDKSWMGWSDVHACLLAQKLADNSADCVVAVQHWVNEMIRMRILLRDEDCECFRLRRIVNNTGWYTPDPKPKPIPKRGRGGRGRGGPRGR
eukprot:TRINITY_DN29426_c0_g2_i1.p1 TRINITY_DN29426_c0_g2~~TRINITY_DN29426_c0_g2_i1.p1  ORF type:complete len:1390 (-),score=218.51 TRINITY_DN29426_c0_g2_i1:250-4419(-)